MAGEGGVRGEEGVEVRCDGGLARAEMLEGGFDGGDGRRGGDVVELG